MHKEYTHITTPDQLISDMYDFVKICGYDVFEELAKDKNIYKEDTYDGYKFGIYNRNASHFVQFRSANGINIFDKLDGEKLNSKDYVIDKKRYSGVGMIASESFDKHNKWFIQGNVPMTYSNTLAQGDISNSYPCGVFMPLPTIDLPSVQEKQIPQFYEMPVKPIIEYPKAPTPPDEPIPEFVIRHYEDKNDYDADFTSNLVDENNNRIKRIHFGDSINSSTGKPYGNFIVFDKLLHKYSKDFVVVGYMKYGVSANIPKGADYEVMDRLGINTTELLSIGALKDSSAHKLQVETTYGSYKIPNSADVSILESDIKDYKDKYGIMSIPGVTYIIDGQYVKFNYAQIRIIKHLKGGGNKYSGLSGSCYLVAMPNDIWEEILNAKQKHKEYQEALQKYEEEKKAWQAECDEITEKYKKEIEEYTTNFNKYKECVEAMQSYIGWANEYVPKKYDEFLEYYNNLFDYTLYCNDSIGNDFDSTGNTLIFSLVKQPYRKAISITITKIPEILSMPDGLDEKYYTDSEKVSKYNTELKSTYSHMIQCEKDISQYFSDISNKDNVVYDNTLVEGLFQTTHLSFCDLDNFDNYDETGFLISGSANNFMMDKDCYKIYDDEPLSDKYTRPVFGSSDMSTTFLRIYNKNKVEKGIFWASSGTDNLTGASILSSIRTPTIDGERSKIIPSYYHMQSTDRLDWGKNFSSVSGMTLRLFIYISFKDSSGYRPVGDILNVNFVSLWNMQTAGIYNFYYPHITTRDNVFPFGKRRGIMGFDGISIRINN